MQVKNAWIGGLDRDTSKEGNRNQTVIDCRNFRPVTDTGFSTTALENIKGNLFTVQLTDPGLPKDLILIGACQMRERTILFTTSSEVDDPVSAGGTDGQIWELTFDDSVDIPIPTLVLRYASTTINFSSAHPIYRCVSRWENEYAQKVYWTDNYNQARFINLAGTGLITLADESFLEYKSNVTLSQPILDSINSGGNHKAGNIQYGYLLYTKYGSSTKMSPLSNMIHLSPDGDSKSKTSTYNGGNIGDVVNKNLNIKINDVDTNYTNIRVYSFFYDTLSGSPLINMVYDDPINGQSTITINDNGSSIGTLTVEEYNTLSQEDFIMKSVDDMRNILFPTNIQTIPFDVTYDARTWRFKQSTQNTHKYTNYPAVSSMADSLVTSIPAYAAFHPETEDAFNVNPFNIEEDGYLANVLNPFIDLKYAYQYNSLTLGGSGTNIRYSFGITETIIDEAVNYPSDTNKTYVTPQSGTYTINGRTINNRSYSNSASPYLSGLLIGYQRDEVYRFGIVFKDKKGRPSYVKWINDIRMPHMNDSSDYSIARLNPATGKILARNLFLNMHIDVPAEIEDSCVEFDIVRVKRGLGDHHILAQGPLCRMISTGGIYYPSNNVKDLQAITTANASYTLYSPEISYNKNLVFSNGDYINIPATYNDVLNQTYSTFLLSQKMRSIYRIGSTYTTDLAIVAGVPLRNYIPVIDGKLVDNNDTININSIEFRNVSSGADTTPAGVLITGDANGTTTYGSILFSSPISDVTVAHNATYATMMPLANYKNILRSQDTTYPAPPTSAQSTQYGGETFYDRARNTYISCGVNQILNGSGSYDVEVWGGDTIITMFEGYRITEDIPANNAAAIYNTVICPVETTINCPLAGGYLPSKGEGNPEYYQEFQGIYTNPITGFVWTQDRDMFVYNTAYSRERDIEQFLPTPINTDIPEVFDTMTKFSDTKTDGEVIDSWLTYQTNNYNLADGRYGPVTDIINFGQKLICIQESGIGIWAVKDRSLISDASGAQLALGTGDILERIDYIDTVVGSSHQSSIAATNNAIYFFDINSKKWYRMSFSDGMQLISDLKGMGSYIRSNVNPLLNTEDNPIKSSTHGCSVGWDRKHNEVYLTMVNLKGGDILRNQSNYTLVYNELLQLFTAFYDFIPTIYVDAGNKLLSVSSVTSGLHTHTRDLLYIHDIGNRGEFYDVIFDSTIRFLTNAGYVSVFDNLTWLSEVYDGTTGLDIVNRTFNELQVRNDYQDSGLITIDTAYTGNARRRIRSWHMHIPRDSSSRSRMRDAYNDVSFSFINGNNDRMVFHNIETSLRPALM